MSALTDWQQAVQTPWAYSQEQLLQMGTAAGVSIPEVQSAITAGAKALAAKQQATYAAATQPANAGAAALQANIAQNAVTPEQAAFMQAAATDPGMGGMVQAAEKSYLQQQAISNPLNPGVANFNPNTYLQSNPSVATASSPIVGPTWIQPYMGAPIGGGTPAAASGTPNVPQLQQLFLEQQNQIDPTSAATRGNLGTSYLNDLNAANAGQLPAGVQNQINESARSAQTARGNALGTSQAAQEAMSTGLTGLQIKQQAQQNAQGWLSSGLTPGQQSAALYDWRTGLNTGANQGATSYLSSGQTPYGIGTGQLANIQNQASAANQGTQYNPSYQGGPNYSYINPNAGQDFSTGSNNWYNAQTNQALGVGALQNQQQANTYGLIGAGLQALGSAVGGATHMCWVAREVFGETNPEWTDFRDWMMREAPKEFRHFYNQYGPEIAEEIREQPLVKGMIRHLMREVLYGRYNL